MQALWSKPKLAAIFDPAYLKMQRGSVAWYHRIFFSSRQPSFCCLQTIQPFVWPGQLLWQHTCFILTIKLKPSFFVNILLFLLDQALPFFVLAGLFRLYLKLTVDLLVSAANIGQKKHGKYSLAPKVDDSRPSVIIPNLMICSR